MEVPRLSQPGHKQMHEALLSQRPRKTSHPPPHWTGFCSGDGEGNWIGYLPFENITSCSRTWWVKTENIFTFFWRSFRTSCLLPTLSISCGDKHWLTHAGWPPPTPAQAQGVKSTQTLFVGGKGRAKTFHLHLVWKLAPRGNAEIQNTERRQGQEDREGQKDNLSSQTSLLLGWKGEYRSTRAKNTRDVHVEKDSLGIWSRNDGWDNIFHIEDNNLSWR